MGFLQAEEPLPTTSSYKRRCAIKCRCLYSCNSFFYRPTIRILKNIYIFKEAYPPIVMSLIVAVTNKCIATKQTNKKTKRIQKLSPVFFLPLLPFLKLNYIQRISYVR